jgi:hypothetical protein
MTPTHTQNGKCGLLEKKEDDNLYRENKKRKTFKN